MFSQRFARSLSNASLKCRQLMAVNEPITTQYVDSVPSSVKKQIDHFKNNVLSIPMVINGNVIHHSFENKYNKQKIPYDFNNICASYPLAGCHELNKAIEATEKGKVIWSKYPLQKKIDIFWKAGHLVANEYRSRLLASTMLGQGKNLHQAEIDAICELADFFRFNAMFREQLEKEQPISQEGERNVSTWGPLNGFVGSITPFNFTAIGGNLATAPLLMGNTVIWKPSDNAILSNYIVYELMLEAGMPPEVIQFVPSEPSLFMEKMVKSKKMGGTIFTGSSQVFDGILKKIYSSIDDYNFYPRVVGETGGMNYHFVFPDAENMDWIAECTIRGSFEYSGQKCSATRRLYLPSSKYDDFKRIFEEKMSNMKVGSPEEDGIFTSAVIHERSYETAKTHIEKNYERIVYGGECYGDKGYYVKPTIIHEYDLKSENWKKEIFGPVLLLYVYNEKDIKNVMSHCVKDANNYSLTGAIFTNGDYEDYVNKYFMGSVGNFYVNDKSTGSVVGNQPFGGFSKSGTNDKCGSKYFLTRLGNSMVTKYKI